MTLPPLAELLRWVAEMPAAFKQTPEGFPDGRVRVRAVIADLLETYYGEVPDSSLLSAFDPADLGKNELNRLRWVLATAHLLWHPSLRNMPPPQKLIRKLLLADIAALAGILPVEQLDREEERREELIRRALRSLDILLPGESEVEAEDRFKQVDTIERSRILKEAAEREKRAREVREAMARKAAQEAAAKVSRE